MRFPRSPHVIGIVLICATALVSTSTIYSADKPNLLLIAIDDLNDWVSPLGGHPQADTPNFDRVAARGVTFANAHCNVPICSPSRTSLMTGLQPHHSGVYTNGESIFDLEGRIRTLPEHFAANGYRTFGAGKLFHGSSGRYAEFFQNYGPGSGNQGGPFSKEELDTLNQNPTHTVDRGPGQLKAILPMNRMPDDRRDGSHRNNSFDWGPVNVPPRDMPDGEVAQWAIEQLQSDDSEQPFFLGAGFYRPHQPLFAPQRYFENHPLNQITLPETLDKDLRDMPAYARRLARLPLTAGSHKTVTENDQWDEAVRAYLACVTFVDDLLGQVVAALDESTHADNTWVVIFSDHGYHLGEKQHWGKFTPWRESTRIPLIVVPPRSAAQAEAVAGTTIDTPVSLIDLYPTLVNLCQLSDTDHSLDGNSLAEFLDPPEASHQTATPRVALTTVGRGTHSVVDEQYRYIRYFDGSEELYDFREDPNEWQNRAEDETLSEEKNRLRAHLPEEPEIKHYVRYGWWKAILFKDSEKQPLLYRIAAGTGSGGGIGETKSAASENPQVLEQIQNYLADHPEAPKRLIIDQK